MLLIAVGAVGLGMIFVLLTRRGSARTGSSLTVLLAVGALVVAGSVLGAPPSAQASAPSACAPPTAPSSPAATPTPGQSTASSSSASPSPTDASLSESTPTSPTGPTETSPTGPTETSPTEPTETSPTEPTETSPTEPTETSPTEPTETTPTSPVACTAVNDKSVSLDTDDDGVMDACDLDADNDGILDVAEDDNGDGLFANDDFEGNVFVTSLGDGIPNVRDLDSDNDGVLDLYESGIPRAVLEQIDTDRNGVIDPGVAVGANGFADVLETAPESGIGTHGVMDTNNDGKPDFLDVKSNGTDFDLHKIGREELDTASPYVKFGFIPRTADADNDGIMNPVDTALAERGAPGSPLSPYTP